MEIFKINSGTDINLLNINVHKIGLDIMREKSRLHFFYIKNISSKAAIILKQESLSIGAELVTDKEVINFCDTSNALLIASQKQIKILIDKLSHQDFGLKNIAEFLSLKFDSDENVKIMGIINSNNNSFNINSCVSKISAILSRIEEFISSGADYIDIGACSSSPFANYCGKEEELRILRPILAEIYRQNYKNVKFSLDSFDKDAQKLAIDSGFDMINDISANMDLIALAKKHNKEYVLMHKLPFDNKFSGDIMYEVDKFFAKKLDEIHATFGNDLKIYLDIGFGFGKSPNQNLMLTKNLEHFNRFNYPLLYGASAKRTIDFYSPSSVDKRLSGSLFLALRAIENGAKIIRVHDVFESKQLLDLYNAYNKVRYE